MGEHVAPGAQAQRLGHIVRLRRHGQHDAAKRQGAALHLGEQLEARAPAQIQVEEQHLGHQQQQFGQGLRRVGTGADDAVPGRLEHGTQPIAHDQMIFHQIEPAGRHGLACNAGLVRQSSGAGKAGSNASFQCKASEAGFILSGTHQSRGSVRPEHAKTTQGTPVTRYHRR